MRTALDVLLAAEAAAMAGFVLWVCALVAKDVAEDLAAWCRNRRRRRA